jgi:hypothetical protein
MLAEISILVDAILTAPVVHRHPHPRQDGELIDAAVSDRAVYVGRLRATSVRTDHASSIPRQWFCDEQRERYRRRLTALAADALATAAFVLGPSAGIDLLARHGAEGLIVTPSLGRFETPGLYR